MTWHADQTEGRPVGKARDDLIAQRERLVFQIELMKDSPLNGKSAAAARHRVEDLTALAKQVLAIDKKLGR